MATKDAISATPAKLRSGDWGARVQGQVEIGDTVTITTRAGAQWDATVEDVVWSGDSVSICRTRRVERDDRPRRRARRQDGPRRTPRPGFCRMAHCNGAAGPRGYCSQCEHDEF